MIQTVLPDGAQTHDAEIAARSGDVNTDTALTIRIDRKDNENLALCEAEALRSTCSPASRPSVEGRGGDKHQSAEAATGRR